MRLLLVEDDDRIARDVTALLEAQGHRVDHVANGEEAWFRGDVEDYAAVVLDLGLPGMDGLAVLKRWRANGRAMPVLVLSARGTWKERVEGIDAGADDYLPKPFEPEELAARLRALIRRSAGQGRPVLEIGGVSLDPRAMRVRVGGVPTALSPQEYRLLDYLMLHAGRVVPPSELIEQLYGDDASRETNTIEVLVGRLRRKLGVELISTRRGFGYTIELGDPPP
ncbi:MAG: response regulator transcription factor [Geminicoccaceae bacterium]